MSLLFFDSFKNYTFLPMKWEECTDRCRAYVIDNVGRKSGAVLSFYSDTTQQGYDHLGKIIPPTEEVIVGFAFKKVKQEGGFLDLEFCAGDVVQSNVRLYDTSFLWQNHDETLRYGVSRSFALNDWNYFEAKIKTHTVSGTMEIRVNEFSVIHLENIDTSPGDNYVDRIRFKMKSTDVTLEDYAFVEDLYIADTLGSINNNFLGNCEVTLAYPSSQGTYSDYLPSPTYSGTPNYEIINSPKHEVDPTSYTAIFASQTMTGGGCEVSVGGPPEFNNTASTSPYRQCYIHPTQEPSYYWFKFDFVNIPKHAKITNAKLQLYRHTYTDVDYPDGNEQVVQLERSGTPPDDITAQGQVQSRPRTYSSITTTLGVDPREVQLATLVQELVSRNDWQENSNAITAIINYRYTNAPEEWLDIQYRNYRYSQTPLSPNTPKIEISWELPSEDSGRYIQSDDIDKKEAYTVSGTLPNEADIIAVNHSIFAKRKTALGNDKDMSFKSILVSGGTTYTGTLGIPSEYDYTCISAIDELNPATGSAWVNTDFLTNEFGFTTISG